MEAFQSFKELIEDKVDFVMESYILGLQECLAKVAVHFPKIDLSFSDDTSFEDITLSTP